MPVYLRTFYYKQLVSIKKEEKSQVEKSSKQTSTNTNINRPNIIRK